MLVREDVRGGGEGFTQAFSCKRSDVYKSFVMLHTCD